MLHTINWSLPEMEQFAKHDIAWLTRLVEQEQLVNDASCLGWAFWPTKSMGYLDEVALRKLANFIEIQNKPFWDEYEEYCKRQEDVQTPEEWLQDDEFKQYTIMDPDGWRGKDAPSWETPLTRQEFKERLMQCTVLTQREI